MDWTAKLDQQRNALMRVFYMFVFMTLLVIRAGLDARFAAASSALSPSKSDALPPLGLPHDEAFPRAPPPDGALTDTDYAPSLACHLDQLYAEALALLYAAELVARRLRAMAREIYELMNAEHMLAQSFRGSSDKAGELSALTCGANCQTKFPARPELPP